MTKIFIETSKKSSSEYVFFDTLLKTLGLTRCEIITVGGKDKLASFSNELIANTIEGGNNIIIFDADNSSEATRSRITGTFGEKVRVDGIFLFSDNHDDGIFEDLLEQIVNKQSHQTFFDCFSDYAQCLEKHYKKPDVKDMLYEYISLQKGLTKQQRERIKRGDWLFDDPRYWDLDADCLLPLKNFLQQHVA